MGDYLTAHLSQAAREAQENAAKALANQAVGDFVNVTGDTMTGTLEVPGLIATATASIATLKATTVESATLVLSGAATIAGEFRGAGMVLTGAATIANTLVAAAGVTLNPALIAQQSVLGGATIAPLRIIASTASQAFFDFRGAIISTASLNVDQAQSAGVIPVWIDGTGGRTIGYIAISKGVV